MQKFVRILQIAAFLLGLQHLALAQNHNFQLRSSLTFPGQTLANVCGWTSDDGREYALVGGSKGLIIVEITDPANPVQIVQIPGPDNLWKEIKTYSHYAYVTSEGGAGVQIVDLSDLPNANLQYKSYFGTGDADGNINTIHALHIDVTKGVLYTYGSQGQWSGGVAHDLTQDPYNPVYLGRFDQLGYIHDGYADNDTLYGCHIYSGLLSIVDMSDKQNPILLGSIQTPGKFTHNSWLLDDHKHILTTDEATPSFVACYDISDPSDIKELDRFSIDNGNGSIGHNTHVLNDYAITSWYTGGVVTTDCHRPSNMVEVGRYDTWAGTGPGFDGCWGAFPYFPSGTVIASNINPGQLFILTPNYKRAGYLEGVVLDGCDGAPLAGALVEIVGAPFSANVTTANDGVVKTGATSGASHEVKVSKPGYGTQTFMVNFEPGVVVPLNVTLQPLTAFALSGSVTDETNNQPLANIPVTISNGSQTYQALTNAQGVFELGCVVGGTYTVSAGIWGYISDAETINVNAGQTVSLQLKRGYYDDFQLDYSWSATATATAGLWERGEPFGTSYQGSESNPELDIATDAGDQCYVTGNTGGGAGADDVDNGKVVLTSPAMDLTNLQAAILDFHYWFFNAGGSGNPNDYFEVRVSNGTQDVQIYTTATSNSAWNLVEGINLASFVTLNNNVRVSFITEDVTPGHLVEAAVDGFQVTPIAVSSVQDLALGSTLQVSPNPSSDAFQIQYEWTGADEPVLELRNTLGQIVWTKSGPKGATSLVAGQDWPRGTYTLLLKGESGASKALKIIKL